MAETAKKTTRKPKTTTAEKPASTTKPRATRTTKKAAATPIVETAQSLPVTDAEIAALAHQLWLERGGQHGGHHDDWFRAEQLLRGNAA